MTTPDPNAATAEAKSTDGTARSVADTPQKQAQAMVEAIMSNPTAIPARFKDEMGNVNQTFLFQTCLAQVKGEEPPSPTADPEAASASTASPDPTPPSPDDSSPASIADAFEGKPVDNPWEVAEQQIREKGQIDEAIVTQLKEKGVTEAALAAMAKGIQASKVEGMTKAYEACGGKDNFNATMAWAKENITDPQERAALAASLKGEGALFVLQGLHARAQAAAAESGQVDTSDGGTAIAPGTPKLVPFQSGAEQQAAMSDKRYITDPVFRAEADARVMIAAGVPEADAKRAVGLTH